MGMKRSLAFLSLLYPQNFTNAAWIGGEWREKSSCWLEDFL